MTLGEFLLLRRLIRERSRLRKNADGTWSLYCDFRGTPYDPALIELGTDGRGRGA